MLSSVQREARRSVEHAGRSIKGGRDTEQGSSLPASSQPVRLLLVANAAGRSSQGNSQDI